MRLTLEEREEAEIIEPGKFRLWLKTNVRITLEILSRRKKKGEWKRKKKKSISDDFDLQSKNFLEPKFPSFVDG